MSTNGGTGAAVLKVTVSLLERMVPSGIGLIRSWWKGKKILVIGQFRSGKSTFIDYLRFGIFEDEKDTSRTVEPERTGRFDVKLGRDKTLELVVKEVVELPGQVGPTEHANAAFKVKPDVIVLLLDLTTPLHGESDRASSAWLTEFCNRYEKLWKGGGKSNPLKCLVVLLNKQDRVKADAVGKCKFAAKKVMEAELSAAVAAMKDDPTVMPCVLVTNPEGAKAVDSAITHIAKTLEKRR